MLKGGKEQGLSPKGTVPKTASLDVDYCQATVNNTRG